MPDQFRTMTPREVVLHYRQYLKRNWNNSWRPAALIIANMQALQGSKSAHIDKVVPSWESLKMTPEQIKAANIKRAEKKAAEYYKSIYNEYPEWYEGD